MKQALTIIGLIIVGFVMLGLLMRACSAPVIYETSEGEVCGCITDGDIPTLSQCNKVDRDKLHEVITVSTCK